MKKQTVFEANDGTRFDDESKCLSYEEVQKQRRYEIISASSSYAQFYGNPFLTPNSFMAKREFDILESRLEAEGK